MFLDIFRTSIYKTSIKNDSFIKYFKNILSKEKKQNKGKQISNVGGFQSNYFYNIDNRDILYNVFLEPSHKFVSILNPINDIKIALHSWWINENKLSDYNTIHNHSNLEVKNIISGVYYIEAPKDCGRLVIQNMDPSKFNDHYYLKYFDDNNFHGKYYIEPQKYDLILFNSESFHYVESGKAKDPRISVAFNIKIIE
jgi:uncharacterized protein (TIGR02466 family)